MHFKNLSMDDIYPDLGHVKDVSNSIDLLNECKNYYEKEHVTDLTDKEITKFVWITSVKKLWDKQSKLFKVINVK